MKKKRKKPTSKNETQKQTIQEWIEVNHKNMNKQIRNWIALKNPCFTLQKQLSVRFYSIFQNILSEQSKDDESLFLSNNVYEYFSDEYDATRQSIEKDFNLIDMVRSIDLSPYKNHFEKVNKEPMKIHLKNTMRNWLESGLKKSAVFYGNYFFGLVCLWHYLDMVNDKDCSDFHMECIFFTLKTISNVNPLKTIEYIKYHEQYLCKLENVSHNPSKKQIIDQVNSWEGTHPFCRFMDGKDTIGQMICKIEHKTSCNFIVMDDYYVLND